MRRRDEQHIIKKYPNRRLYDTQTSTYITLADVKQMVLAHDTFRVVDAKTNDDLTRSIMLQIILEEENEGVSLFTTEMLAQIIRSYGNVMQGMLGSYLEKNMQAFADIQSDLAESGEKTDAQQQIDSEVWQQLLAIQTPMMQGMMSTYIKQSREMFLQMREVMASQTAVLFQNLSAGGVIKPELLKSDASTKKSAKKN
ncbi:MAG: polyhydroxyalkanoate synthesis repressor PhaR [Burkholderiaceae bacterium]